MLLDKFIDKEARQERKLNNAIALQADFVAEYLAANVAECLTATSEPLEKQTYNIGRCPEHLSIEEFASRVGHAAMDKFPAYSIFETPIYNNETTILINTGNSEVGIGGIASVPPPSAEVRVVFDTPIPKRALHSV